MTAPAPSFTAAGQSAAQPRNNSFSNFTNRLGIRPPCSSLPGREASAALGTSPFPFQPTPFTQINHAHFAVSRLVQSVDVLNTIERSFQNDGKVFHERNR